MKNRAYIINASWDAEAEVWVATSDDAPGLATEARDIDVLIRKLRVMIPELLEANGYCSGGVAAQFVSCPLKFAQNITSG